MEGLIQQSEIERLLPVESMQIKQKQNIFPCCTRPEISIMSKYPCCFSVKHDSISCYHVFMITTISCFNFFLTIPINFLIPHISGRHVFSANVRDHTRTGFVNCLHTLIAINSTYLIHRFNPINRILVGRLRSA